MIVVFIRLPPSIHRVLCMSACTTTCHTHTTSNINWATALSQAQPTLALAHETRNHMRCNTPPHGPDGEGGRGDGPHPAVAAKRRPRIRSSNGVGRTGVGAAATAAAAAAAGAAWYIAPGVPN